MTKSWTPDNLATEAEDTIAAIATPPGEGGIGIVRLSGREAIPIAAQIFRSARGCAITRSKQRVFYGHIVSKEGDILDEVLLHVMRAPHTYTREDVVEINAHGGPVPLHAILEEVLRAGARLARPGEFTLRAFLNGRIDLVQAEAVLDIIRARTRAALQTAQAAARGALSTALYRLRETLADLLAQVEASVDFPEEDLPDLVNDALFNRLADVQQEMEALLATAEAGRLYREGVTIAIAGKPNVGKSSLFNALLRDTRAIVSPYAGTTRDRIEEYFTLQGVPVRLVDTAGMRATNDEVEKIGVELAREAVRTAQLALLVFDASTPLDAEDLRLAEEVTSWEVPVVLVWNKMDLCATDVLPAPPLQPTACCRVSALTGAGLPELEQTLARLLLGGMNITADQPLLTHLHQKDSLRRALECVVRARGARGVSPEFLALELRQALDAVGEITGETTPDDILATIFSSFCIGK